MELFNQKTQEKEQFLSTYKDPFKSDKVESIIFHIGKSMFSPYEINMSATIKFKNGDTSGAHNIKADDFPTLVKKVDEFVHSL